MVAVEARSVTIPREDAGAELVEALQHFAQSRSTKALIRRSQHRDVQCTMRAPFFGDCRVNPGTLARGLRKLFRETIAAAEPGDRAVMDFARGADDCLVLAVSEMGDA